MVPELHLLHVGVGQNLLLRELSHGFLRCIERLLQFCNRLGVGFFGGRGLIKHESQRRADDGKGRLWRRACAAGGGGGGGDGP